MLQRSVILLAFCAFLGISQPKAHATTLEHGPSPAVQPENDEETIEIGRVRLHNIKNGEIEGSRDEGKTWGVIGHILVPCIKVNVLGFNASKYGQNGSVVATAVNAIHLRTGYNAKENRGIIWSLAPLAETAAGRNSLQQEISPQSAAYTDMPGGTGLFGGPFTPFVGNPLFLDNDRNNSLAPLPLDYIPKLGDSWVWQVRRPKRYPREIVFEKPLWRADHNSISRRRAARDWPGFASCCRNWPVRRFLFRRSGTASRQSRGRHRHFYQSSRRGWKFSNCARQPRDERRNALHPAN